MAWLLTAGAPREKGRHGEPHHGDKWQCGDLVRPSDSEGQSTMVELDEEATGARRECVA
jgi:hypothetical protein